MAVKTRKKKKPQDASTRQIYGLLRQAFPGLSDNIDDVVYRYNPVSIRVLVVSDKFDGLSSKERMQLYDRIVSPLDQKTRDDVTLLILLTPEESNSEKTRMDWLYNDFHNPELN